MMIPKYLDEISESVKSFKFKEKIKMKCKCNRCLFTVLVYCDEKKSSIKHNFNEIIREDNKLFFVKRNLWGRVIEKRQCENTFLKRRKLVKLICENCGKEYTIFDNYYHGYDAVISFKNYKNIDETEFKECESLRYKSLEVYVNIFQDLTYEKFMDEFENASFDEYLNSFSNIDIYGIDNKKKKVVILSEETA